MGRRLILGVTVAMLAAMVPVAEAGDTPGRYIVVLKDSVRKPGAVASEHARSNGAQVSHVYRFALKGYSAAMSERAAARVANDGRVAFVEEDGIARTLHHRDWHDGGKQDPEPEPSPTPTEEPDPEPEPSPTPTEEPTEPDPEPEPDPACGSPQTVPWGITRVAAPNSHTNGGTCVALSSVHAYIIDTGVDQSHADLDVAGHVNFAGGPNKDCNGHGTHVAGTVAALDNAADVVGAAPGAKLVGVKVLGCSGSGTWSGVIAGIDWVTKNAVKPAVANMSLGGGANNSVDQAVRNSADSGVTYAVAAGNSGANACNYSPARAGTHNGVVTVAATGSSDQETSWSNYGSCVDIWAPGLSILSTRNGGGTTTMSGTSMAAPHVGGVAAYYLASNAGASSSVTETALKSAAVTTGTTSKDGAAIKLLHAGAL